MQYSVSETIRGFPMARESDDQYSDKEATQRMEDALRRALNTPPKPHSELVGKSKRASARAKSRVKKAR
jgi:hypothetical protein